MGLEKQIGSLAESDLHELIANGVSERRTVEYKRTLPGTTDEEKKEFLADVSSFANSAGGSIIYGMEAKEGLPVVLSGFQITDIDGEKLRLENMIRDGISPRIIGVEIGEPIRINAGGTALVIRIPRSWLSPHMVTYKGHSKFYSRNSAGKYPLNVEELRSAFSFSAATRDRLRDFRAERMSRIVAGLTPVPIIPGALVILHLVPLSAFESGTRFEVSALTKPYAPGKLQPIYSSQAFQSRYNFDGVVHFEQYKQQEPSWSYLQIFRDGTIETVNAAFLRSRKVIPSLPFEQLLLRSALPTYLAVQKTLGVLPPIFVGLSLTGVSGYTMGLPMSGPFENVTEAIDRDSLILPDVVVETFESNLDEAMKPVFDSVWNAAGRAESLYYDGTNWKGVG